MAYVEWPRPGLRPELLRWMTCAALVLTAHALALIALGLRSDVSELEAGSPVVMIELAPIAVAPLTPENELAPGPQQMQAENQEQQEARPEPKELDPVTKAEVSPAPNPVVTLPPEPVAKPVEQPAETDVEQQPTAAVPLPSAPPPARTPAARPGAPAPGSIARPSIQIASWQRLLAAHLQRFKRYPPQAKGEQGVASLAFRLDRQGHLVSYRILRSSGSGILDGETLALIKRANPFPAPPQEIGDNQLSFVVPIRYAASAQR